MEIVALVFLIGAILIGFFKKINVGLASLGLVLILAIIGKVDTKIIFSGFPSRLFLTLLGTMFFFCLLQENNTLELLSKKIVALVGKKTYLIPIIIYLTSYILSAVGPGAISVQAVMAVFAISLAIQMQASPILLGSLAILGAVGGTTSPIALTGIIVSDLTKDFNIYDISKTVFYGVSFVNFICAVLVYIIFKGYKLKVESSLTTELPTFDSKQKIGIVAIIVLVIAVIGFRLDVGLVAFSLSLILVLLNVSNEKTAIKMIPWNVLVLICGVNVLMNITQKLGGIKLLADILASMMNDITASSLIGMTAGIMSWFSSANGVVMPTLIPTVPDIAAKISGNTNITEMVVAIVACSTVAGISPLSIGGSLILATYSQKSEVNEAEQQKLFSKLFILSFGVVLTVVLFLLIGGFKIFL